MNSSRLSLREIAILSFWFIGYSAVVATVLQCFIVPRMIPESEVSGLLPQTDSIAFHEAASRMADKIRKNGWSAWQMQSDTDGYVTPVVAVGAAIYAITVSQPWTLLPLNAIMHGLSALFLVLIFFSISQNKRFAILGTLPFLLFPSSLSWYSQFHRDGYVCFGFLLIMHAWCRALKSGTSPRELAGIFFESLMGTVLTAFARRPMVVLLLVLGIPFLIFLLIRFIQEYRRSQIPLKPTILSIVVYTLMILLLLPFFRINVGKKEPLHYLESGLAPTNPWERSSWIPTKMDIFLSTLSQRRRALSTSYPQSNSLIDAQVQFQNAGDVIQYSPRALQVALFSPFPSEWFSKHTTREGRLMRLAVIPEMIVTYIGLLFLAAAGFRYWRNPKIGLLLYLALFHLIFLGLSTPNQGALVRYRYSYLTLLVGLGILAIPKVLKRTP